MILIVEGNSPARVAQGLSAAQHFAGAFLALGETRPLRMVQPDLSPPTPADFEGVVGAVFTGAGNEWSTDAPEAAAQRMAMEMALDAGVPVWGSCNGMNLAMCVLGGTVGPCPAGYELGMAREVTLTPEGASHPMMEGRPETFEVPCIHRDAVTGLPAGTQVLAGNAHHPVQAVAHETGGVRIWGVQYHPELTLAVIAGYVRGRGGPLAPFAAQAADMDVAHMDGAAAARLGTTPEALAPKVRALELRNWLASL